MYVVYALVFSKCEVGNLSVGVPSVLIGSGQWVVSFCACILVYCVKHLGVSVWSACCQFARVSSMIVVWFVCVCVVWVFVLGLVWECSCKGVVVSPGCSFPRLVLFVVALG